MIEELIGLLRQPAASCWLLSCHRMPKTRQVFVLVSLSRHRMGSELLLWPSTETFRTVRIQACEVLSSRDIDRQAACCIRMRLCPFSRVCGSSLFSLYFESCVRFRRALYNDVVVLFLGVGSFYYRDSWKERSTRGTGRLKGAVWDMPAVLRGHAQSTF